MSFSRNRFTGQASGRVTWFALSRMEASFLELISWNATLEEVQAYVLLKAITPECWWQETHLAGAWGELKYQPVVKPFRLLGNRFSRMRSKGSRFTLGVWGLRVCSLDVAFTVATVRNRPQPSATVRAIPVWPCLWEVLQRWSFLEVSDVSLLRFAWQAWHFVTFRRVLQRVENRFAWQAQYFCDVFRRRVAVFVAGAALWTCPSPFFVAGAAL